MVTLFNERETVDDLVRRTVATLDGEPFEVLLVDDGSTDGTWEEVERVHAADERVRGVRLKRNFGQHPAMHAGLVRARGDVLVTMDGDLQNSPEDIPKLVAAVRNGSDVASGRRAARRDSWGRTLPSRLVNGMLRRFTGVTIADFGCAFNAYRRSAVEPMLGAIGRQKFTKALILSGGANVAEVDVAHSARGGSSRYTPMRLTRLALHVVAGFWPQPIQWIGVTLGTLCSLASIALGHLRRRVLDRRVGLPGASVRRSARRFRPRRARVHPRPRRGVPGPDPARRGGTPAVHDRSRAVKRILVTGGAGFISSAFIRHLLRATPYEVVSLDALTYAGNLENLADVRSHERLSFVHGDIRDEELVREVVAGVDVIVNAAAESHVEKSIAEGASEFVATNVEGTRVLLDAMRAVPVERFILISSSEVYGTAEAAPMDEEHALNPRSPYAATKAGADRLAYSYWATYDLPIVIVRPFNNYGPHQHPEKVIPRFILQALAGEPLTVHGDGTASRDWLYVDDDAEAIQAVIEADLSAVAGEVVNVATGRGRVGLGDRGSRPRADGQAGLAQAARGRAPGSGSPPYRVDGQGRAAARMEGADLAPGGARAHRRVVSRQ